jgi:AdoMet-dependent rRNA methyltransferase SPB1
VDGAAAGGGDAAQNNGQKGITIFHKKFDEKTRSRGGYDMTNMDASMRNIGTVADFIESGTYGGEERKDPIQMLSFCTGLSFTCHFCKEKQDKDRKGESTKSIPDCNCNFFLNHRLTTTEIKECLSDLKVLNKGDFKGLLTWREKLRDDLKKSHSRNDEDEDSDNSEGKVSDDEEMDSDAEEENIQADIEKLRAKKLREQKRLKKKERELAAKRRKRAALGMDLNAIELPEAEKMFTLTSITSKGALEAAREVDLNKVTDDQLLLDDDEDEIEDDENVVRDDQGRVIAQGEDDDVDEDTGYSYRLDRELDEAYNRYLKTTKTKGAKTGTKMVKRSKRAMREKAMEQAKEDQEMMMDDDTKKYAEMLQGPKDSENDDSSDDEEDRDSDDDGFNSNPMTPEEHSRQKSKKVDQQSLKDQNPLIHRLPEESTSVKTARWFSNPLFENIGTTASFATMTGVKGVSSKKDIDDYDSDSDGNDIEELSDGDEDSTPKLTKKSSKRKKLEVDSDDDSDDDVPLTAESILDMMPKTDKQLRHEKRLKSKLRMEKKKARREKLSGEADNAFEVVEGHDENEENEKFQAMSAKEKQKVLEARALIKAGLGSSATHDEKDSSGFEIVKKSEILPTMDPREYNSENEDYDSDDYAETLALGTMMLRKSKAKALVDASYNRFAWNDPEDLPDWFLDDENKNYRPQLPIPPELLAKMKERFMSLAVRPITKVAEARARKNKRVKAKLASAKKKAEAVANSSDMSEAMKLKAISKAMRGKDAARPSKTYVVAKKGAKQGGKGVKLVDKRLKNDKRSMSRSASKKKNGKKGGLTGSKKRRSHS